MKTRINRDRIRSGFTYVSVVIAAVLIGLILSTYLKLVASQNQMTMRSQAWNRNIAVVEAGIEEALAHLNKNGVWDLITGTYTGNLLVDGWTTASDGGWTKSGTIGDDYYVVTISSYTPGTNCPVIVAEGYVKQQPTFSMNRWASRPFLCQVGGNDSGTYVKRTITCATTNLPVFSKALVATHTIDLNGNGVTTDSYDSGNPAYSTNGRWDVTKRRDRGDIATNNSLTNTAIDVANANIFGSIATGPNPKNPGHANATIGPNGAVGDLAWHADSNNKGIQPGKDRDDMNVFFPDITPPFTAGLPAGGSVTWTNGVTYGSRFVTGQYAVDSLSGKILVTGRPTKIFVRNNISLSGQDVLEIAPGASLIIYMDGASANFGGQGVANGTGKPAAFFYFGTKKNASLTWSGNAGFTGAIYAPNANVNGNGGGSGDQDFSGAAILRSLTFNGHYKFHYDEALGRNGMFTGFTLTSWNEL